MSISTSIIKLNKQELEKKLSYRSQLEILVPRLIKTLDNYLISNNLPPNNLLRLQSWQLDLNSFYYYLYTLNNYHDYNRFLVFNNVLSAPSMMSLEYQRDKIRKKVNNIVDENGETMLEIIYEYHPNYTYQYITLKLKKNKYILENTKKFLINLFSDKNNFINFLDNFTTKPPLSKKKSTTTLQSKKSKKKTTLTIDTGYHPKIDEIVYLESIPIKSQSQDKKSSNIILPTKFKIIPRYKKNKSLNFKLTKSKNNIITNYNSLDFNKPKSKKYKFYSIGGGYLTAKYFKKIIYYKEIDKFLTDNYLPTLDQIRDSIRTSDDLDYYYQLYMAAVDEHNELRYNFFNNELFLNVQIDENTGHISDFYKKRLMTRDTDWNSRRFDIKYNREILIDTFLHLIENLKLTQKQYPNVIRDKFRKFFRLNKRNKPISTDDTDDTVERSAKRRTISNSNTNTNTNTNSSYRFCTIMGGVGSSSDLSQSSSNSDKSFSELDMGTIFDTTYIDRFLEKNNLPTFHHLLTLEPEKKSRSWNTWSGLHFYYLLLGLKNNPPLFGAIHQLNKRKPVLDEFNREITTKNMKIVKNKEILVDTYLYLTGKIFNYKSLNFHEYSKELRDKFYEKHKRLIEKRIEELSDEKLPNDLSLELKTELTNIGKKRKNNSNVSQSYRIQIHNLVNNNKKARPSSIQTRF